ncbi:MAG TPA: glycoside hydrolase family 2 TIM barrel-domain containing protein [Terracidiphilus sp.]|nr:glycoside hydrolase family 2 TIM barrel-domain containing protein [Terracidiphilus sp.]
MKLVFARPACMVALVMSAFIPAIAAPRHHPIQPLPAQVELSSGWKLADIAKVPQQGAQVAEAGFDASAWYTATVPGTVLTTLVNNKVYPEPLYGENNRPEIIPESLARTKYWFRTQVEVPASYKGRHVWLNFDGINYDAQVWVNGSQVGSIKGAFIRGNFDITPFVTPGKTAAIAVLISPQPHPGVSHEHTLRDGLGQNGGESAIDGPTFLCTMGWDWIPAIRDRDTGIWQKVYLSASGPVLVKEPLVTTDLPLPKTDSSDVAVQATVENVTDKPVKGVLKGTIAPDESGKTAPISFEREVDLAPHSKQVIKFTPADTPALHVANPLLWWPNGYGPQNLYTLHWSFGEAKAVSDAEDVSFGIRKISYSVPGTDTLTISVNGVPVFIRGGDWGLDEAMKRIPYERMDTLIKLHKLANLNMIRNWVGQSTSEDFYKLCDKYGILVWDEFFQPNPGDGPNPTDIPTYIANVRDKVLRFRNHPSIVLWCARNEGYPPPEIDKELRKLLAELEPTRRYQPSSTDGAGVRSHGPYWWRTPREFYKITDDYFKTETGSVSIPTLESIHGMMPKKDWNSINDDWAEHDLAKGNSGGDKYPGEIAARYGDFRNLADFVRKAQMANYEAFRAMYEGRNAKLFHPATAILTWMSNPAQPSFVWQIYHYDFEPMSSFYAVMHASEMLHIQYNQATGDLEVINNRPTPTPGLTARVTVYGLDGQQLYAHDTPLTAAPEAVTSLGKVDFPTSIHSVHFLKLDLRDSGMNTVSTNFYWLGAPGYPDDFQSLQSMPEVALHATATAMDENGQRVVRVTLSNPTDNIALMAHVQLRRKATGERVLPVFASDNYISLTPHEERTITLKADTALFKGDSPLVTVDGWNTTVAASTDGNVAIQPNTDAMPDKQPATGLPFQTANLR